MGIFNTFKIMDSLLNDGRKYPNVVYGLATGTGLAKLGQVSSGRVKCRASFLLPSYPPINTFDFLACHVGF